MYELIKVGTKELQKFLSEELPKLSNNWWEDRVIDRLSFQQQKLAIERNLDSLDKLDFAALIRLLDQNWFELSQQITLPREARSWVKELQSVRNKWAHLSRDLPDSEIYRDVDTLGRVMEIIGASELVITLLKTRRDSLLIGMSTNGQNVSNVETKDELKPHLFSAGEVVCLRSDNSILLPIVEVITSVSGIQYKVFQDNKFATYYESQLQAMPSATSEVKKRISINEVHAHLTALQLEFPSATNIHSLRSGRVKFVPYQYRPVLKLIQADQPRLLIADEVGVGKTIEAGLIIQELRSRTDLNSILIICPKALVAERKWEMEMKRFDEKFSNLDGRLLKHCLKETYLEGEWPEQYSKAIVPFSLFDSDLVYGPTDTKRRTEKGLISLDPPPKFDLVIVDEAHHIRNSDTYLHQGVKFFCDNAQAVIFLTATPVQLGSEDLFTLLNVIRPDLIIDTNSFQMMAEPNQYIHAAVNACRKASVDWHKNVKDELSLAINTEWGRLFLKETPKFQVIWDQVGDSDDVDRVKLIKQIEELNTFSGLINRTRRRDIGDFTIRKPETLSIPFTDAQQALHDSLLEIIAKILTYSHGSRNVKFMMTTIRRQAASCLYGLAPLLKDILARKVDSLELLECSDNDDSLEMSNEFVDSIKDDISGLLLLSEQLDEVDPKAEAFINTIKVKTAFENNKVLIFTTFRHSIDYLAKKLKTAGFRFALIHGSIEDDVRADLRKRFSLPKSNEEAIDVLLSSEVGCEGLDFQFCNCLINYDLPWNPMRIEQRIGRIDRYGQESETVAIVNIITPGTVDADIHDRCLSRIGVFERSIGGSEEILGEITQEIHNIADSFTLTNEEKSRQLAQLSDNKIRVIAEEEELENRQAELFGLHVPTKTWQDEIELASSFWLSPSALKRCIEMYINERMDSDKKYISGDMEINSLRLSQEARKALLEDYRLLPRSKEPINRNWEKWLKGNDPTLSLTFNQEIAVENSDLLLITPVHPLVKQSINGLNIVDKASCLLEVKTNDFPVGKYLFALYHWEKKGVKRDDQVIAICANQELEQSLLNLITHSTDSADLLLLDEEMTEVIEVEHHQRWSKSQADHIEANRQLVSYRIQSLNTSHKARCKTIEEQLNSATNDKIKVMKASELVRANADYELRMDCLEKAAESGDVHSSLICYGIIKVIKED
jgi:SNF2 family DNA or RNA helicase